MSSHAPDLKIYKDESELAHEVIQLVDHRVRQRLASHGLFHLTLTGGTLGTIVSDGLVIRWNQEPNHYKGLHLWWGDERFVPAMSQERNSFSVLQNLSEDTPIHVHQVMASDSNVDLDVAAKRYNTDLVGIEMDLILLGIGPDGHVASLFPGQWDSSESRNAISVADSPKPPATRVSFSMAKINSAKAVWMIASGVVRCEVVAKIIARDDFIPATHVHGKEETLLFVDHGALSGG